MGIEPTSLAWKAKVLPLNYTRSLNWWWGLDSNQRTQRERIYSPSPLTTRPPHQKSKPKNSQGSIETIRS